MYASTAAIGQMGVVVRLTKASTPFPNWSHFDLLRYTQKIAVGEGGLSTATYVAPTEMNCWIRCLCTGNCYFT